MIHSLRKLDARRQMRSGATLVETAIVLGVLLFMITGVLQLGISTLHSNVVSDAARRLAREACVHGSMAEPSRATWGPVAISGTATDGSDYAATILSVLPTISPADVSYELIWLDGDSDPDSRVQARVVLSESPVIPFLDWLVPAEFTAISTRQITH